MADSRSTNRAMFWRIMRRLFGANPGRLFVMMLALGAGAAVTAALLNLQVDAKQRLTTEFRAFGTNVIILPKADSPANSKTLPEMTVHSIPVHLPSGPVSVTSVLYVVARLSSTRSTSSIPAIVVGLSPFSYIDAICGAVGVHVVKQTNVRQDDELSLTVGDRRESCVFIRSRSTGGPEDDRIEIDLSMAQRLAELPGRISAIELVVPGTPKQIADYVSTLQKQFPELDVRPVRQFTEGEAKIYNRISGLLTATVGIVLLLTALCVMAAMTNVAMERKMDVGLMKAIGGSMRRVLRLFLAEAALLGLAGGIIGGALGIFLSIGLGKAVFGVAARPRLIVYPVAVALTVIVAIISAFPLRRLASIRPASVFRGEA